MNHLENHSGNHCENHRFTSTETTLKPMANHKTKQDKTKQ